ncbi:unnamed protein product [Wuchereria bancrofti]|uniref:PDZ domain-containing protein n=1 Tax=Wuchereria bancrofti TaxID=6293 RepID=A0A3P7DPA4_WUCBA|nr:unnamed protein product [Wuchereria bancrofti]
MRAFKFDCSADIFIQAIAITSLALDATTERYEEIESLNTAYYSVVLVSLNSFPSATLEIVTALLDKKGKSPAVDLRNLTTLKFSTTQIITSSLFMNPQSTSNVKELIGSQSKQSSDDSDATAAAITQRDRIYPTSIKKILLTRKYHDTNVYNDIGIRVIGGKKLPSGELAAFVSMVNRGKARETLGEIREGDRVLEWNGVLLTGKTFEEVEQVIAASRGEIEVVVASNSISSVQVTSGNFEKSKGVENQKRREQKHDEIRDHSQKSEAPPIPAHRCADGQTSLPSDSYAALKPSLNNKTIPLQSRNHITYMQQVA